MLLKLGGETLIERGYRLACEAFGAENVVVAIPAEDEAGPLGEELRRIGASIFALAGYGQNVLRLFHACAHTRRWHSDSIIFRYTPDDPHKDPAMMRRVAIGERLPVELGGEAFTLAQLDYADGYSPQREHLTLAMANLSFLSLPLPPPCPPGPTVWSIDTRSDYQRAKEQIEPGGKWSIGRLTYWPPAELEAD